MAQLMFDDEVREEAIVFFQLFVLCCFFFLHSLYVS